MSKIQYVASSNVNIFPSTRRVYPQDFSARLMTESSIARIINKLIDKEGFIISSELNDTSFEFNIFGYYFQIKNFVSYLGTNFSSSLNIYASIFIDTTSTPFTELYVPQESGDPSNFQGLAITTDGIISDPLSNKITKTLYLLTRSDTSSNWQIVQNSRIKFDSTTVGLDLSVIDGGVI